MDFDYERYQQQNGNKSSPMARTSNIRVTGNNEGVVPEFGNRRRFDIIEAHEPSITM